MPPADGGAQARSSLVRRRGGRVVAGDDQVRPLLDGSGVRAPSVDPAVVLSHAVGGNRAPLVVPDASTVVSGTGGVLCQQVTMTTTPTSCDSTNPHFDPFEPIRPEAGRYAVRVQWTALGTPVTIRPPAAVSLTNAQAVALRWWCRSARRARDSTSPSPTPPAGGPSWARPTLDPMLSHTWGQEVRMPLTNAVTAGLDLGRVTRLEIVPRAGESGAQVWLLDAWGWRPGLPAPQPVGLPRADLGELTVPEGDSGTVTHNVPAQISGSGNGRVRVFVVDPTTGGVSATVVTVPPGSTMIPIPIQVTGNTQPGDAYGLLTVRNDDG